MIKTLFALCLIAFLALDKVQADNIDDFVKTQIQQRQIPGLQLAVVKNGKIIKTASYGFANIQDSIKVDDNTLFAINSMTKAFTGVAVVQLVEQG